MTSLFPPVPAKVDSQLDATFYGGRNTKVSEVPRSVSPSPLVTSSASSFQKFGTSTPASSVASFRKDQSQAIFDLNSSVGDRSSGSSLSSQPTVSTGGAQDESGEAVSSNGRAIINSKNEPRIELHRQAGKQQKESPKLGSSLSFYQLQANRKDFGPPLSPLEQLQKPALVLQVKPKPRELWLGELEPSNAKETTEDDMEIREAQAAVSATPNPAMEVPMNSKRTDAAPVTFPTTQLPTKSRLVDVDGSIQRLAQRNISVQKHLMQASQVGLNGFCIFATWFWPQYYYILLPLISATVALNVIMVFSVILRASWNAVIPEKIIPVEEPESMVLLIPCYNETKEELIKSLDSLVAQRKVEAHKQAIVIVCDGKVRGPGMEKSTGDYLLQDILTHKFERKYIAGAYTAWDQAPMNVIVQRGKYQGLPYYCIVKQQNQGKRDGLILTRSFLYNFNRRLEKPKTVFNPKFFDDMASFLINDADIKHVVHLIGMDADTVFDEVCVYELLQQSRFPETVGVCGYVSVDWKEARWNLWRLYQSAEYTIAQGLRRLHQSIVTHKVSCLPGCCQLLRICEETCGDHVLLDLFGYCPEMTDGLLKQIRATASEDRNHVCHMLTARPKSQTRQALQAKAYTDVPLSWSVFLSQRRRWTLGATSNDLMLITAPGVQWFERILATVNVTTWFLNPFIFASLASFIFAITVVPIWIIMCFVSVMLIPIIYYFAIPVWLCNVWRERVQFWVGCSMYIFCGPFINIFVLLYATLYMDSVGWGKTRKVIAEGPAGESTESELERLEKSERSSVERPTAASDGIVDLGQQEKAIGK